MSYDKPIIYSKLYILNIYKYVRMYKIQYICFTNTFIYALFQYHTQQCLRGTHSSVLGSAPSNMLCQ